MITSPAALYALALFGLTALFTAERARAQEDDVNLSVRLVNRTCGAIRVQPVEAGECPAAFATCDATIERNERVDLFLASATFPSSMTIQVDGRCAPSDRAVIAGQCQANLFSSSQRTIDSPGLTDVVRGLCDDVDVNCPGISEFQEPGTFRHRTVEVRMGLCDVGADGIDVCQPECAVP